MKKKIGKLILTSLISLIIFYLIFIPFSIIYYDNGQVLAILNNIHVIVLFSVVISLIIILLHVTLSKSIKLVKVERILALCLIGGNLIFVFTIIFSYISFSPIFNLNPSFLFAIIGIICTIFNGLFIIILATVKKKNIQKT